MLGRKSVAGIFGRKGVAGIECETQRRRVRLNENVGHGDFALEIRPLAGVVRIFMVADIEPGPAIKRALTHPGDVIGHQIISQTVALVGRAIEVASLGMNGKADAITDAGGENAGVLPVGIEHQDVGATALASPAGAGWLLVDPLWQSTRRASHTLPVIAGGTHRYQHALV